MAFEWIKNLASSFNAAADDRAPWEQDRDRLFSAIRSGDAATVDKLAAEYSDEFMTWKIKDGTALQVAQRANQLGAFKILIDRGADIDETADNGWTPLLRAARDTQRDFFDYLLEKGANLNAKAVTKIRSGDYSNTVYTGTALHLCIKNDNKDMVVKLLERGANANVKAYMTWGGYGERTAADYAAYKKKFTLADACKRADKIRAEYLTKQPQAPAPPATLAAAAAVPADDGKIAVLNPLQLKKAANAAAPVA